MSSFYPFTLAILPIDRAYSFTVPGQRISFLALDPRVKRPHLSRTERNLTHAKKLYEELKEMEKKIYTDVAKAQDLRHGGSCSALVKEILKAKAKAQNKGRLRPAMEDFWKSLWKIHETLRRLESVPYIEAYAKLEHCIFLALRVNKLSPGDVKDWRALANDAEDVAVLLRWHEFTLRRLAWEICEDWPRLLWPRHNK